MMIVMQMRAASKSCVVRCETVLSTSANCNNVAENDDDDDVDEGLLFETRSRSRKFVAYFYAVLFCLLFV